MYCTCLLENSSGVTRATIPLVSEIWDIRLIKPVSKKKEITIYQGIKSENKHIQFKCTIKGRDKICAPWTQW